MKWKKNDSIFVMIILVVVIVLVIGTTERTTKAVPNDATHQQVTSKAGCMACHDGASERPQPLGHPKSGKCFQCHTQPQDWVGQP